jgi:putative endonuclease
MKQYRYYVYILASKRNGTLYIGVANNLLRRIKEHKDKKEESFTKKYNVDKLIYYETYGEIGQAIVREKQLKAWKRQWKIELIEKSNLVWRDLYDDLCK